MPFFESERFPIVVRCRISAAKYVQNAVWHSLAVMRDSLLEKDLV